MSASREGLALLALRLVLGAAVVAHGIGKLSHALDLGNGWAVFQIVAGGAVLLGVLTRIAAFLIAVEMAIAIFFSLVPHDAPFVASAGRPGFELPLTELAIGFALLVLGPGPLSIDARRSGDGRGSSLRGRGARGRR
jgi:putative oxidoreductase